MKILHTSDWHIGRLLYRQKRYDEFTSFLDWLVKIVEEQVIDGLIVSGDIFDTTTPSNKAQQLYYQFLCKVAASSCRHVVLIAGNHDSPTFLNAPKELLLSLNVHVVGAITDDLEDEIIVLSDSSGLPEAIVCAVPYLRDRDIRRVKTGESIDDKNTMLIKGVKNHYIDIGKKIEDKKVKYGSIPVIGMGHLFTAGGKTIEGDGVRELYVGSLAHVGKDAFPDNIDYMALGHLHVPQKVGQCEHIRYSGSPLPIGFSEATQEKSVVIVDFNNQPFNIQLYPVPSFQSLERIKGSMDDIIKKIDDLKAKESKSKKSKIWLEIEYQGQNIAANLRQILEDCIADSDIQILRIKNQRMVQNLTLQAKEEQTLDDLNEIDVFTRLLDTYEVMEEERPVLMHSYKEILTMLNEEDTNAQ
jgi:DNA repair protein SbcD/Mre11